MEVAGFAKYGKAIVFPIFRMGDGDLNQRHVDHQKKRGCLTTAIFGTGRLLYHETHENRAQAEKRERQIKKWSHA